VKRRRLRAWTIKLALFGVTSLIGLLLLEVAIRWLFPYYVPGSQFPLRANEDGVTLGFPSRTFRTKTPKGDFDVTVAFNQYGYRDVKDLKQSQVNSVFVAGDSFSVGWGVQETNRYSNHMERQLGVPVYNISIPEDIRGYIASVNYATKQGAKIRNLVIGLCMENDLWDYTQPVSTHALYAKQMNRGVMRAVWNWFKGHSALWICVSYQVQRFPAGRAFFEKLGVAKNIEALTHANEYSPQNLRATRDELLKLATNYNSVVLVIPSRGLWWGKNRAVEDQAHREMVELLREAKVQVVDMRPVFEKGGQPLQFYFANDPHWNAAGHQLAGDELTRFLREQPAWREALASPDVPGP
jgi:hypothetical protein